MNQQYIYISFLISVVFFIVQHILNKKSNEFNKYTLKDSIYIFIISLGILHANEYYNKTQIVKTEVFTSEPCF